MLHIMYTVVYKYARIIIIIINSDVRRMCHKNFVIIGCWGGRHERDTPRHHIRGTGRLVVRARECKEIPKRFAQTTRAKTRLILSISLLTCKR